RSQIENEKKTIREKQLQQAFPLKTLMKSFLGFLQAQPADTKKYFLQWMKIFIDELSCGSLEELRRDYHELWSEILSRKKREKKPSCNDALVNRLDALSDEINDSTIGLEHLLREVGQIYEALELISCKKDNFVKLPEIAAELMDLGYSVELMDGDASYLPLRWVGAIFDSLIERLGDKRVFVLSVLGIQSTGKSTLLNAMFGLQFNVSAGRCTRGAFMQLIPVGKELQQDLGFDFVLVVDTEGLRAIEMANKQSLNHDNELATFVIGVGNVTVINIFGENPSEMQDVLQIAVQAFLRMKKVNLSPSCLFVHQNVGEATAKEQNMEGQRRLQEKLDEMTVVAAQQEFCDVSSFSDVIAFDVNTHIHYFAHLWEGNPPMAPPNPTYSQNVQQLKSKILQAAKNQSQHSILRLSSLKDRIGDLWNALVNENFVFSFKNSLEIAVYRKLESAFSHWTWRLRNHILDVQMRLDNKIRNGDLQKVSREHLEGLVRETSDAIEKEVEKYFREDKDCETLIQWKSSTELKLKELKETLLHETKKKCENLIGLQKEQRKLDARKLQYEDELLRKSRDLAVHLKGKSLSEGELTDSFTLVWNKWIAEVLREVRSPERVDIDAEIEDVLVEHFKEPGIHARITSFPRGRGFSFDPEKHIMKKKSGLFQGVMRLFSTDDINFQHITDNIIECVMANIAKKEQEKQDYSSNFIHEILNEVQKGVNSVPSNAKCTFNREYSIDLSLYLCTMAAERFKAMHEAFQKANDPVVYLSSKREYFFQCFQISCQGATSVTTFVVFLCDKIEPALRQAVYERTAKDIAEDMQGKLPDFQGNRANLEVCILKYLAEQENFEYFKQYLTSPKQFCESYIETRVRNYCLNGTRRLGMFLDSSLNLLYRNILSAVSSSTQIVKDRKDREDKVSLWLDEFCRELSEVINLPRSDLKGIEHQEVTDIEFLSSAMAEALAALRERLMKELADADLSLFPRQPHTILATHFSGCWEQCPFSQPADTKKYFLQWMKIFIDELSCGSLEELRRDYHELWSEILSRKKREKKPSCNDALVNRLDALSDEINDSTIGLEHLLREVGQIYEALQFRKTKNESFVKLPEIAAELMDLGYPVELMDGDASYLPLRWVGAIFDSLIERLGDKRVFVLSVLGIQSTGKSTLLNAMFGLQFNVSAGRCTRGAFMQLIPVGKELQQDLGFDFVLVVDTEGLRAIEMANKQSLNHDNELATFVIGVGNVTVINIFGENPSEMQDVLQIAVQAFLRMKKVNLSPSCVFVHQNVGEATAKEQNMEGQRRFQEKLDEMTVVAAQQEFCDVSSFSDVIGFDVNTHIHYFAHLWEGNPPMAPPNPTYSQNVQQLKSKIFQAAKKQSQRSILRLSSLKDRIGDLWNALLNENFVFSFKNSLEIAVYRKLESAFSQWTWRLRSHILDVQMRLDNKIRNGDRQNVTREHLEGLVRETSDAIEKEVEKYFREDKDHEILIQWKSSTELKLKELKETLLHETKKKCENLIELQKEQRKLDARKLQYEDELLRKSRELAVSLKGKSLSEGELKDNFTVLWNQWIAEVSSAARPPERVDIDAEIEDVLVEHFKEPGIHARITSFPKDRGFYLDPEKHIVKKSCFIIFPGFWSLSNADVINFQHITNNIIECVMANIDKKEEEKRDYSSNFIHEILNEVQKGVNSVPSNARCSFNREYSIDLSLYLCKIAAGRFKAMHEAFQKANDPVVYLSSKREDFFLCFQISCQGATSGTTFATFLCDKIEPALLQAVFKRTAKDIAEDMQGQFRDFQGSRANLEICILRYLAEQENFEYFKQYLRSPKQFCQSYIETRVRNYCLDGCRRLRMFLDCSLNNIYRNILSAASLSTQIVKDRKDREDKVSLWLDEFCRQLTEVINLPRSDLKGIEHQEVTDIEFLSSAISKALAALQERLMKELADADLSWFSRQPHTILAEHFSGCWAQCPFCGAVCTNTMWNHDGDHQLVFHRPQALTGWRWHGTDHLVIDICSSRVASDCKFKVGDNDLLPLASLLSKSLWNAPCGECWIFHTKTPLAHWCGSGYNIRAQTSGGLRELSVWPEAGTPSGR
ncbi:interferon-induced very large GTPase 1-like, partial [Onychostruthus taczanowskii]|uniref:interferon-induced very large GTPase 1-like n=1 Tax=Onychostruthus taczanowskii TaxID=356909 RepID=UPI001B8004BC